MQNTVTFPKGFSEAKTRLRLRFRKLSSDTIDDGIQHARIQYWEKNIGECIPDANQAFGWFLHVAYRYLDKEVKRSNRFCNLLEAERHYSQDYERQYLFRELLDSLEKKYGKNATIVIKHAMGYSLSELAESEKISLDAAKQRHARGRRQLIREGKVVETA